MNREDKVLLAKNDAGDLGAAEAARVLTDAVTEAGRRALSMLEAGVRSWSKEHDSPVTEADIAIDEFLHGRLCAAAPTYAWQSEESPELLHQPTHRRRWVVDPIDGTRSYIQKLPDWSIAVALVEDGRPIAAVVHAPATGELFTAVAGRGAFVNGAPIRVSDRRGLGAARLAGPRTILSALKDAGHEFEAVPRIHSLALRFARVAAGHIDGALASHRSRDWDLAAADLLVHEAGGLLTTLAGQRLLYDNPGAEHPALAAAGSKLHPGLLAALKQIPAPQV